MKDGASEHRGKVIHDRKEEEAGAGLGGVGLWLGWVAATESALGGGA
jgi:hypothetical protein